MQTPTIAETDLVLTKTKELCQAILDQPEFALVRQNIDTFMANDEVRMQYQLLSERNEHLQHKQQQGVTLTDEEVQDFEGQRQAFFDNPVATGFMNAQREVQKVQESVGQYLNKTFELGRLPGPDDFDSGSCGHGCGCHH